MASVIKFKNLNRDSSEKQYELFGYYGLNSHKYAIVDIKNINHLALTKVCNAYDVSHILDARCYPTFRRPKFDSSLFVKFLNKKSIEYISISTLENKPEEEEKLSSFLTSSIIGKKPLFILVLIDKNEGASSHTKHLNKFLINSENLFRVIINI